jgi:hypothetical protein
MSIVNQIRRYLHALLFIALAVVIISAISYLINAIPDTKINLGEREEVYTEIIPIDKELLYSLTCEAPNYCTFHNYYIPYECVQAEFDYSQATALSSYWVIIHNEFTYEYTVEPGSILIVNHTGALTDLKVGPWETVKIYCVYGEIVTTTTKVGEIQISSREILSFVYFAVTIVIVIAGIRKFLPQF